MTDPRPVASSDSQALVARTDFETIRARVASWRVCELASREAEFKEAVALLERVLATLEIVTAGEDHHRACDAAKTRARKAHIRSLERSLSAIREVLHADGENETALEAAHRVVQELAQLKGSASRVAPGEASSQTASGTTELAAPRATRPLKVGDRIRYKRTGAIERVTSIRSPFEVWTTVLRAEYSSPCGDAPAPPPAKLEHNDQHAGRARVEEDLLELGGARRSSAERVEEDLLELGGAGVSMSHKSTRMTRR